MMWDGWERLGRYKVGRMVKVGDRMKSPVGGDLVMEVEKILAKTKEGIPTSVKVRIVGDSEGRELVMKMEKSRNDFPGWIQYRPQA